VIVLSWDGPFAAPADALPNANKTKKGGSYQHCRNKG
jgi:hypothetical protein